MMVANTCQKCWKEIKQFKFLSFRVYLNFKLENDIGSEERKNLKAKFNNIISL